MTVELFTVAIGEYDHHEDLEVEAELKRVATVLADFGVTTTRPWDVAMADRGADAVGARLEEMSAADSEPTVLYWLGHGWSDTMTAALAHARSAERVGTTGISPRQLADVIRRREARSADEPWLFVVIDACQSARFAELLAAELDNLGGRRRVVILGTSVDASTTLGRFGRELELALRNTFADDQEIPVTRLADELRDRLGGRRRALEIDAGAVLQRTIPIASGFQGPLDVRQELDRLLRDLPEDERRHFVTKAQGGELVARI